MLIDFRQFLYDSVEKVLLKADFFFFLHDKNAKADTSIQSEYILYIICSVADPEGVRGVQTNPLLSINYFIFMENFRKNWSYCTNQTPLSYFEPPI